jgi:hypothetical protein
MNLDNLAISRRSEAHPMILDPKLFADRVEALANLMPDAGVRVVKQTFIESHRRRPPDRIMFAATANAIIGSKGFHPVSITSTSPATTPKLVQLSVRTCFPSASRINE